MSDEYEYTETQGPRKNWDGEPDLSKEGWEPLEWERFDCHETRTWRRKLVSNVSKEIKHQRHQRLARAGLRQIHSDRQEEIRQTLLSAAGGASGKSRSAIADQAREQAWAEFLPPLLVYETMVDRFKVLRKDLEQKLIKMNEERFVGFEGDIDDIIDPDYDVEDANERIIDAFDWLGEQFRRVVKDTKQGTKIDFKKATKKPPTAYAVQLLEEYARAEPGSPSRRDMPTKVHQAVSKRKPPPAPPEPVRPSKPDHTKEDDDEYMGDTV